MGFRFRRSIKVAPGVRINLSKGGASVSVGRSGATGNGGRKGIRTTTGIPGTYLSYVSQMGFPGKGSGTGRTGLNAGMPPERAEQIARWARTRGLCILIAVAALGILVAAPKDRHSMRQDPGTQVATRNDSPAPVESRTVDSSPSRPPAAIGGSTPLPTQGTQLGSDTSTHADAQANAAALAAAMERLRSEHSRVPGPQDATPPQAQVALPPAEQVQAPPQPPPTPVTPIWSHETSMGTRWRLGQQGSDNVLFVDLGYDQVASIHVAPQFQNLSLDAANFRVDWLRSQITQAYSARSASYRYTRDGSIYPMP